MQAETMIKEAPVETCVIQSVATAETEDWDLVIEPQRSLFSLNLHEVLRYRDLLFLFVKRDLTAQYKQTILGPLWHLLQPAMTTVVFLVLFSGIAHIPTDGIEAPLFYMSGLTIWNYFAACLTNTSNTFVANAGIFGKVYFPRLVTPLSVVLSNMVRFAIQFALLVAGMVFFALFKGVPFSFGLHWLLVPVIVLIMAGLGLGLGIIISSLTTKYRDLTVLVGFGVQLLMYATPVAYPLSFLRTKSIAAAVQWNPLSAVVEGFRYAIFGVGSFDLLFISYSITFLCVVLLIGVLIFNRVEKTFMDTV